MTQKILIIGNQSDKQTEDAYYKSYEEYFSGIAGESAEVKYCLFTDLSFDLSPGEVKVFDTKHAVEIKSYDVVFIRGKIKDLFDQVNVISKYLKSHNKVVINDYSSFRSSSKLGQAATLNYAGFTVPRTLFGNLEKLVSVVESDLGFPVVVKDAYGSHGRNNYLVKDKQELTNTVSSNPEVRFVVQQYIPNKSDFRVLVIGGEYLIIERSAQEGTYLNNTSQGATARLVDKDQFPKDIVDQAKSIARLLDMSIAGVDVLYDAETGRHVFLEVNSQPQLMTGAFVDEKKIAVAKFLESLKV